MRPQITTNPAGLSRKELPTYHPQVLDTRGAGWRVVGDPRGYRSLSGAERAIEDYIHTTPDRANWQYHILHRRTTETELAVRVE